MELQNCLIITKYFIYLFIIYYVRESNASTT